MKKEIVLIGVGEVGGVFARGFLKAGYTVVPVTRSCDINQKAQECSNPEAVVIGVGEKDLQAVLNSIPNVWKDRLVLIQNELLPRDWTDHKIDPTVISVWFEKKPGQDVKVIIPSPVFGKNANIVAEALSKVNISTKVLASPDALLSELVLKNLYIVTTNVSGLQVQGNVGQLWDNHQILAKNVANDVLDIQFKLAGKELDRSSLIASMVNAFNGDLDHKCMGRSAPARLERALKQAEEFGLNVSNLKSIAAGV